MRESAVDAAVRATWRSWREAVRRARARPRDRRRLHEFRIATRRLQAMAELLAPARDHHHASLSDQIEPAFRAAGKLRDEQLCIERLHALRHAHPVAVTIEAALRARLPRRQRRYERALAQIDVARCKRAVHALRASADWRRAARRLSTRRRQLRSAMQDLPAQPSLAALHRLRLRVKQVRYMQEWMGAVTQRSLPPDLQHQLPLLQQQLGDIADTRVLRRAIERWKPTDTRNARAQAHLLHSIQPPCWAVTERC